MADNKALKIFGTGTSRPWIIKPSAESASGRAR